MATNTLTWNANTETNLAGYNAYRQIDTGPTVKLNTTLILKGTQTFVDSAITVDGDYKYTVTAVNTGNLESAHSAMVDKVMTVVPPAAPSGLVVTTQ